MNTWIYQITFLIAESQYYVASHFKWKNHRLWLNAISGLLVQLGLHPILLLLLDYPHHHWYDWLQQLFDFNDHDDQDKQVINTTMIRMIRPTLIRLSRTQQSGYGNFAAETFGGRLFCLFFGIVGKNHNHIVIIAIKIIITLITTSP